MFWKLTLSSGDLLPRQRQSLRFAEPASSAQVHGERSNWVARLGGCFEVRGRAMLHPRIPTGYLLLTLPLSRERVPVGERRCQKEQLAAHRKSILKAAWLAASHYRRGVPGLLSAYLKLDLHFIFHFDRTAPNSYRCDSKLGLS